MPGSSPACRWTPARPSELLPAGDGHQRLLALGRASTVIAHEMRNPLMLIKMSLRELRPTLQTPDQRDAVRDIDEYVERLSHVVADVLDFARPIRFVHARTDLNAVCAAAAASVAALEAHPPIRLLLDPALPAIVTDGERLRAVFVNLLTNARQAVSARPPNERGVSGGESPVEIQTLLREDSRIEVRVRDRGVGIRAADLERVFEPYFTTRRSGSGVGLALVKSIITGLEGTIVIHSELGVGTEVVVTLPACPGVRSAAPSADLVSPRVLVIEDDASIRKLLTACLEMEGFVVDIASNGAEGLQRMRQSSPSVVLLDLMMPVMDGEEFRVEQLADPRIAHVPVICISGLDDAAEHMAALRAAAVITKPFDVDQIVSVVRDTARRTS